VKVFRLAGCALGTEAPLLPHDFSEGLPTIRRPTQDVFLRALSAGLHEGQTYSLKPLRIVEQKPDRLPSGPCGTPPRGPNGKQRGLNWMSGVLRGDFHLREPFYIQPFQVWRCSFLLNWGDDPFAHNYVS
jgi:hypothetical protein